MYDRFGHFKPVEEDSKKGERLFEYSKGLRVDSITLACLILLDIFLRETTQRIDYLERKMRPMQKVECTKDDLSTLKKYEMEVEELKRIIPEMESVMYCGEAELPERPLKRTYDKIRQNPAWYLREELINDCIRRGGCCGRSCGCCEHRHLSQNGRKSMGIGHCTIECWCCEVSRGFEMTEEEREKFKGELHDLLFGENPSYLLALAEPYFCMPGMFGLGRISFVRTIAWYWKKGGLWQWKRVSDWLK